MKEYYTGSSARVVPIGGPPRLVKSGAEKREGGGERPTESSPIIDVQNQPDVDLDNGRGAPALRQTEPNRQSRGPPAMSLHLTAVLEFSCPCKRMKLRQAHLVASSLILHST